MRKQIGTVTITRTKVYNLDPSSPAIGSAGHGLATTVVVEPGEYPVFEDGISRYWRMTGHINNQSRRLGDGFFTMNPGDEASDDDVVFYSARFGPDDWAALVQDGTTGLTFTIGAERAPERAAPDGGFRSYPEAAATTHPATDRAVGALHNYLAAMREQRRRHAELEAAKAAIPADQLDVYIAAAAEIGPRYRDNG